MKRTRHRPEQIVTKLQQAATELAGGKKIEEVCLVLFAPRHTAVLASLRAEVPAGLLAGLQPDQTALAAPEGRLVLGLYRPHPAGTFRPPLHRVEELHQ